MTTTIHGLDPATGDVLELQVDTAITRMTRRPQEAGEDLPFLAPGLIDLQVNGFGGIDINGPEVSAERITAMSDALAGIGVTTWVPTIVTASEEAICHALRCIAETRASSPALAHAIPFAHVEGPFLSAEDGPRGVHDIEQIRPLDADEVTRWQSAGPVGLVTVSPHTDDAPEQIARIVTGGVMVAVGHTHASTPQITAAVDAGASLSTHLGNGIFPRLARHPNPIWTQLAEDRLTCGLIADGHHLPPETLEVMLRAKGPDRAFLVSDATELAGREPGLHRTAVGGEVELTEDGRLSYVGTEMLAGAASDVAAGLRFVLRSTSLSLHDALALVTRTPGRVLGRDTTLRTGAVADLVTLTADGTIQQVWRHGALIERP
ncbi:amidohydrolase family protein [Brachybacterium sp. NBEC-018]|uniref:N-acetylglucosamine-6-phosphate deacetylase n=1 Tax=Brachybacterium sp. NBEC-018 TaxID=2996004 RepID=UPI002175494B|nr:amidohydrolase family protein [Brachybacterium sp. NBEC-018]UVY84094.1 amidohydrolase family protein [Brachybacterium sp. NBEC-018]